jgi:hypothetical protein
MSHTTVIVASVLGLLAVGVASVFTLPAGAESARQAQARLDAVPLDLPPWVGADVPATEQWTKHMAVAEADAAINRHYTHATTKQVVAVSILYGNQGAMCAHDPNTCYAGSGYAPAGGATRQEFPAAGSALWLRRFEKAAPTPEGLDVCWGFTADGGWAAPETPRMAYAGRSMLYKLYAQVGVPVGVHRRDADNPLREFLTAFLPKLRVALTAE